MFTTRWTRPMAMTTNPVDRLFRELGAPWPALAAPMLERRTFPALNVWEENDNLHVEAEVPGLRLENLEIVVMGDELTIRGKREPEAVQGARIHRQERPSGQFSRLIHLPHHIDADKVEATLRHGVLTITLPKHEQARRRRIEVRDSERETVAT